MSSQIYNTHKYKFSKTSLNVWRIPYYANLSEIKTDFLKSGDSVPHLTSKLKICYTLYSSSFFSLKIIVPLESFCRKECMQKSQRLPGDVWRWGCVTGQIYSSSSLHHRHKLSCDQIKERVGLFILFYLKAALPVLECSKVFCKYTANPSFRMYGIYNSKTFHLPSHLFHS